MRTFPWVLVRVAGAPWSRLERLRAPESYELSGELYAERAELDRQAEALCDALYEAVGRLGVQEDRRPLVGLKRDVFNHRPIGPSRRAECEGWLDRDLSRRLEAYSRARERCESLRQSLEERFPDELATARAALRELSADATFRCGLLLSSPVLLEEAEKAWTRGDSPGRQRQLELSLAKYLSRMMAKTSPFSTYTQVTSGELVPRAGAEHDTPPTVAVVPREGTGGGLTSRIHLNHYLYEYLQRLCMALPGISRRLPVRVNPSLSTEDGEYYFLINDNNLESFQRAPLDPMIDLVLHLVRRRPGGSAVVRDLIEEIGGREDLEATEEEILAYLEQLVDLGFLHFDFEVSGLDPSWSLRFRELLGARAGDVPEARRVMETLEALERFARRYETADVERRSSILDEAFAAFSELDEELVERARGQAEEDESEAEPEEDDDSDPLEGFVYTRSRRLKHHFTAKRLLYEDVTAPWRLRLDRDEVEAFTARVGDLIRRLDILSPFRDEMQMMRAFHLERYGEAPVGVLRFYEEYFQYTKAGKTTGCGRNASRDRQIHRAREWLHDLRTSLASRLDDGVEIVHLRGEDLGGVENDDAVPGGGACHCLFVQLLLGSDGGARPLRGVVNHQNVLPGHGKGFSRFLQSCEEMVEPLRRWNEPPEDGVLFVENCDGSFYNANIHPPLLPWELAIPESQNGLPADAQIPVTDLVIEPVGEELALRHVPTGHRVYILDLGFQTNGRSPLFLLLNNFSPTSYVPFRPLLNAVDAAVRKHDEVEERAGRRVRELPRVVYEDRVILQRRSWIVSPEACPRPEPEESEASYFSRLDCWRRELGLPAEVFVRVRNRATTGLENLDDRKPQHVHFGSPILVRLFRKLLHRVERELLIEEMLPGPDELLDVEGEPRVTELVLECRV